MSRCPYCGCTNIVYLGVADGGGDYGTEVCDEYECWECDSIFEADCIEVDLPEDE